VLILQKIKDSCEKAKGELKEISFCLSFQLRSRLSSERPISILTIHITSYLSPADLMDHEKGREREREKKKEKERGMKINWRVKNGYYF